MLNPRRIPKTIQWVVKLFLIYLCIFTVFRVVIVILFKPGGTSVVSLLPSFWMGMKYDLRWIAVILSPIIVFSVFAKLTPFYSNRNKRIWNIYLALISLIILFFYGADVGNFGYNHTRISASALNFKDDPYEMFRMIWETYPVVWILAGLALIVLVLAKLFSYTHGSVNARDDQYMFERQQRWHLLAVILMCWFVYGFCCSKPLTRQDAYSFNDNFKSYLALNPFQNFITTLRLRDPDTNSSGASLYYPVIADYLQLDTALRAKKTYQRAVASDGTVPENQPNIVLVLCESFSMYKSSMGGNKLNTTPYFNGLCKQGLFFDRCFTPTFGTARGLFATVTGIPDVQMARFSTQNTDAVNQYTIINNFDGYKRFYFIGGRSQFNNFRGLMNNVEGIDIHEKGNYRSPEINVWGISDKDLFTEANEVLKQQHKPFFALIQTAQNHRPFMLPPGEKEFSCPPADKDSLLKYGFDSEEEYRAFCYSDYCFRKFMETARQQTYFNNTIFVFVGDHGVEGNADAEYPKAWNTHRLTAEHVPLLFYAPALLTASTKHYTVSQVDILPTLAGIIHLPYRNTTLGRDVINQKDIFHSAFIIHHDEGNIGIVTDDYYYIRNINISAEALIPLNADVPGPGVYASDSVKKRLSQLTLAFYETSKWMLLNNKGH